MSGKKSKLLFYEFPAVSSKAWKQKIQYDLKGADYNEKLVWESREGIHVKPFYHSEDLENITPIAGEVADWRIGQSIFAGNSEKANERALYFLKKGVETLHFIVPKEEINFEVLLKDIDLEVVPISFQFNFLPTNDLSALIKLVQGRNSNMYLNIDIIGNLARNGNWYYNLKKDHQLLDESLRFNFNQIISVDITLYENSGADMVQQLGFGLAHAHEYVNHLRERDTLSRFKNITFKVAIGGNYFFEIAKIKALRILWNSLMKEYGLKIECLIVAEPSYRNKTLYDYNMNMVRTSAEYMSGILGGANVILNQPYDAIYHKDNDFSSRIALNQLLILKEEAYFDKVSNAADGAYYMESLTQQMADKALVLFKDIEKKGGFLRLLKNHTIQKKIKESAEKQQEQFNHGDAVLVGTNNYKNTSDVMKHELELYPFVKNRPRKTLIEPIIESRLAEALEQKRLEDE